MASEGYPEAYPKGEIIDGITQSNESMVFHAGTIAKDDKVLTNGGRVLGVTALGDDLNSAISNCYSKVQKISWPHKYYRNDIGKKGLSFS